MSKEIISKELEDRYTVICFSCGCIFTDDSNDSTCPECGSIMSTRWITPKRTWLVSVRLKDNRNEEASNS